MTATDVEAPLLFRLRHDGALLETEVRRTGHRARVRLRRDGVPLGEGTGAGRVQLPLPLPPDGDEDRDEGENPRRARVVVRVLPRGVPLDVVLVVPAALRAQRLPFEPPAGTTAARWHAWQRRHPALWASRHVLVAVGQVLLTVLGVLVLLHLLLRRALAWVREQLPELDLPRLPWPDLPRIPWPDLPLPDLPDLPDLPVPWWLAAALATAKFWAPVLVALAVAVREVRRRRAGAGGARAGGNTAGGSRPPVPASPGDAGRGEEPQDEPLHEHEHEEPDAHG